MSKGILIIESDFEAARQMASALESEGYFVFTASTVESGMDMARRVKPSILFLSPSVEGLSENGVVEFIKDLRSQDASKDIPIMLVTEGDKEYDPRYAAMYGIINFIKKPIDSAEVLFKCRASIEDVPEKPKQEFEAAAEKVPATNMAAASGYPEGRSQGADEPGGAKADEDAQRGPEQSQSENFENFGGPEDEPFASQQPSGPPSALSSTLPSAIDPFEDVLKGFKKEGAEAMGPKWGSEDQDFMPFGQPRKRSGIGMKILYVVVIVLAGAAISFGVFRYMAVRRNMPAKKELKAARVDNSPVIVQQTLPAPIVVNQAAANPVSNAAAIHPVAVNAVASATTAGPAIPVAVSKKPAKPSKPARVVHAPAAPAKSLASNAVTNKPKHASRVGKSREPKPAKARIREEKNSHMVQTGVFSSRANALKLENRLKAKGYPVSVQKASVRGRAVYRVLVGGYSTSAGAARVEKKLKRQGFSAIIK